MPAAQSRAERCDTPVLRIGSLSKTFPGTRALTNVDLDVRPREIHALVGHNGSGKSTLIKVLAGFHHADPGARAWLDGEPLELERPAPSRHHRMRFVHQDLGLVLELNAVDNLALARGYARGALRRVRWREQRRATRASLARCGAALDIDRPLGDATPVERTIVAVAAALQGWTGDGGLLVLDEPTAVLPANEVSRLHEIIAELRRSGTSVLYVSHRLDEIFGISDRVTVLRQGRRVTTAEPARLTKSGLTRLMTGEHVGPATRPKPPAAGHPVVLQVRDLRGRYLRGVSFSLHRGEAFGICGLPGSGVEEVPDALAHRRPRIPIVPSDRIRQGVISECTVAENLTLEILPRLTCRTAVLSRREARVVHRWMTDLDIHAAGPDALISTLSGGNQQKVVLSRCLATGSTVVVLCEPTAGVDIAARAAIHKLVRSQIAAGLATVVVSSDGDDLVALCSRVAVLRDGIVTDELSGDDITQAALVHAMEGSPQPCH